MKEFEETTFACHCTCCTLPAVLCCYWKELPCVLWSVFKLSQLKAISMQLTATSASKPFVLLLNPQVEQHIARTASPALKFPYWMKLVILFADRALVVTGPCKHGQTCCFPILATKARWKAAGQRIALQSLTGTVYCAGFGEALAIKQFSDEHPVLKGLCIGFRSTSKGRSIELTQDNIWGSHKKHYVYVKI